MAKCTGWHWWFNLPELHTVICLLPRLTNFIWWLTNMAVIDFCRWQFPLICSLSLWYVIKKSQLIDLYASIPENLEMTIGVKGFPFDK